MAFFIDVVLLDDAAQLRLQPFNLGSICIDNNVSRLASILLGSIVGGCS